jgi:hypothetical protein
MPSKDVSLKRVARNRADAIDYVAARFLFPSIAARDVGEWDVCFGGAAPLD